MNIHVFRELYRIRIITQSEVDLLHFLEIKFNLVHTDLQGNKYLFTLFQNQFKKLLMNNFIQYLIISSVALLL